MRIDILCLFPEMFVSPFSYSIVKRAEERGLAQVVAHNIRDFTHDRHRTVDDYPYGGGVGMVLKPEPIFEAAEHVKKTTGFGDCPVVLLTPQGRLFTQDIARELSHHPQLMLICGHYEGVDERVAEHLATDALSIGDYVLMGGEVAAMVVVEAVVRLLPGVLGSEMSTVDESHADGLLEYPQYTRPEVFRGWAVPPVLLSGNHGEIAAWRRRQTLLRTAKRRPDLLERATLSDKERTWISESLLSQL
ncbi:MAG TPA: tRNA (guanosine(37)-N1)-methyltransferase TrmD [Dehalococcoidia bacterium]|nr:tRNA (guanosine(37)-N1)-methyltransferase TrmD [Dehalococcoidia bacterium]